MPATPVAMAIDDERSDPRALLIATWADRTEAAGRHAIRYGLVLVLAWIGGMKFTAYEAEGIAGFVSNSPLMSWAYAVFSVRGFSAVLGITEIVTALLIAARPLSPRVALLGSASAVGMFATTLSFLLSTPGVWEPSAGGFPALSVVPGQFLVKDVVLFGASLWMCGQDLRASTTSASRPIPSTASPSDGARVAPRARASIACWTALSLASYAAGAGGVAVAHQPGEAPVQVIELSQRDIVETLDGASAGVTVSEVTFAPNQADAPHRHAGPVFGYVLEGAYEHALGDDPITTYKAGDTFYEPSGVVHRVARNPSSTSKTRLLAVILHPRTATAATVWEENAK